MKNAFSIAAKHSGKGVGMENKSLTIAGTPSLHTSRTEHRFKRLSRLTHHFKVAEFDGLAQ